YRSTSSEGEYSQVGSTSSPYTSYTDTGLSPNTTYYYKVSAYNSSYAGSASESLPSLTSETTRVAFPLNVSATAAASSSITVSWEQVSGATEYKVYRSTTYYGTYSLAGDSTSTSYADTELSPITTYYYKVSAYNGKGEGAQSSYTYATTKLGIPSIVTATDSSRSSITVSWNSVSNASYYYIYRATSSDGEYSQVGSTSSSYTSYTDTGLSLNTTYYYKVSAYSNNYNEESAQSPDFPCTITVTAAQVTVSFTEPKDETITVTQSQNDSGVLTVSVSGSFSSYRWFLDGVPVKDETESSLTLDIGELAPKRHELTVFVTDEKSVQYAKALRFTVWK
ncbi:MAG: fibronectin type III domain-containing protein, partial [Treponema sp.]|nr:fibronectin type III domain-containing protein [Treponema sp.]